MFQSFISRHQHLKTKCNVDVIGEDNDDMTNSYLMVTPDGKFYQNKDNKYIYSENILDVGIEKAFDQIKFFDYDK